MSGGPPWLEGRPLLLDAGLGGAWPASTACPSAGSVPSRPCPKARARALVRRALLHVHSVAPRHALASEALHAPVSGAPSASGPCGWRDPSVAGAGASPAIRDRQLSVRRGCVRATSAGKGDAMREPPRSPPGTAAGVALVGARVQTPGPCRVPLRPSRIAAAAAVRAAPGTGVRWAGTCKRRREAGCPRCARCAAQALSPKACAAHHTGRRLLAHAAHNRRRDDALSGRRKPWAGVSD